MVDYGSLQAIFTLDLNGQARKIPSELRRLFARLLLLDVSAVSTVALTDSFGWAQDECRQQQDIQVSCNYTYMYYWAGMYYFAFVCLQEMNRVLFSAIEDSMKGSSCENLIQRLYHGTIVNRVSSPLIRLSHTGT